MSVLACLFACSPCVVQERDWVALERALSGTSPTREVHLQDIGTRWPDEDVAELLRRMPGWSPGARLGVRRCLVEQDRRRGVLADGAVEGPGDARDILVEQSVARLDLGRPWSDGVRAHRERADLLVPPGLRVQFWTPDPLRLDLGEFIVLLSENTVFGAPVVVHPLARLEAVALRGDGLPRPAEWWLEESLARADCGWIRLLRSIWIAPLERIEEWRGGLDEAGELELHSRLRATEAWAFEDALASLQAVDPARRRFDVVLLCEAVGLPIPSQEGPARVVAAAARRDFLGPSRMPGPEAGPGARRAWARASIGAGMPVEDPAVAGFVRCRRAPEGASTRARGWLAAPDRSALESFHPDTLPGLRRLLQEDIAIVVAAASKRRLPWTVSLRIAPEETRRQLFGPPVPNTAPFSMPDLSSVAGEELVTRLRGDRAQRWFDMLAGEGSDEQFLGVVEFAGERLCSGDWSGAAFEQFLDHLRWSLAARVDGSSLLAGRIRAHLRQAKKGTEGDAAEALERQADRFWKLGSATRPADWLLDLDAFGWLPQARP